MRKILLITVSIMLAGSLYAQKPVISGYLGKINYASIKVNTGVRFGLPEQWKRNDQVAIANFDGFSFKSEIEAHYGHVFSNNFVLEVVGGHNATTIDLNYLSGPFDFELPSGYRQNYRNYYGFPKIVDWYTGVGAKFYRRKKGSLAPLGTYTRLGINFHTYGITFNDILADYTEYASHKYYSTLFDYGKYYYRFIEYNGSIGITRAITDRIIYDVGMNVGWGLPSSDFYKSDDTPYAEGFEDQLLDILRRYHLIKMYGSVSYMF